MREKQELVDDADRCRRRMDAATQLIDGKKEDFFSISSFHFLPGLSGEKVRWTAQSKQFKSEIQSLVGNVLLATGFLSYSGPFNQDFRTYMMSDMWQKELISRNIPFTLNINLIDMLLDAPTIG